LADVGTFQQGEQLSRYGQDERRMAHLRRYELRSGVVLFVDAAQVIWVAGLQPEDPNPAIPPGKM